jgi:hypothetical protein
MPTRPCSQRSSKTYAIAIPRAAARVRERNQGRRAEGRCAGTCICAKGILGAWSSSVAAMPHCNQGRGRRNAALQSVSGPGTAYSMVSTLAIDAFSERQILKKNRRRCSLVRRGRSAAQDWTVRDLAWGDGALWSSADGPRHRARRSATWCRSSGSLPDDRTVRALGPDGPRVRRGDGRSPAAPGSRSREGPRREKRS